MSSIADSKNLENQKPLRRRAKKRLMKKMLKENSTIRQKIKELKKVLEDNSSNVAGPSSPVEEEQNTGESGSPSQVEEEQNTGESGSPSQVQEEELLFNSYEAFPGRRIVSNNNFVVTVLLVCLTALPILMFIMGIQFVRDCPKEPCIPIYMIVGGSFGTIKLSWMIWRQVRSRRFERRQQRGMAPTLSAPSRVADILLTCFLVVWFIWGNIWILGIYWPRFESQLFDPNNWCHETLYVFALVHLGVIYATLAVIVIVMSFLFLSCQLSSSLFVSYIWAIYTRTIK